MLTSLEAALFAGSPDAILVIDADGYYREANPAACQLLGYERDELLRLHSDEVIAPGAEWLAEATAAYRAQGSWRGEIELLRKDGTLVPVEAWSVVTTGPDGPLYATFLRDSTSRREAHAALTRERDLLWSLMDHLPDAVYVKDTASRFLRLNRATAESLGIADPADALGKTDFDFYPEQLAREYFVDEQKVMTTGEPLLNRLEPRSDEIHSAGWWLTSTVPVRDAAGAVVGLVGSGRDITERLQTEEALRESEARQRALLAAMPDMVFRIDRSGTFLDYKADRLADLAASPEAFLGRRVPEVLPADVAPLVEAAIERVLGGGGIETVEYALELTGERRAFEARLVAAGPDEVVTVVRDVTERKRVDAELLAALAAAHAANRATRQFLTMMSHELRTPMQAIMGYAELLLAGPEGSLTPEQAEDLQTIRRGATRLVALVTQMLDLSRLEAGQTQLTTAAVDLATIVEQVRQDVAPQAAAKALTLCIELPADLPPVLGDEMGVYQILLNLVGNAVKFTDHGQVGITAETMDGHVAVAVRDTGIGIIPAVLPHIFEEFHQVERGMTRRYEGAGLGLTIARRLAERMGGRLTVASQPGVGSTFTLHLATADAPAPPAQSDPPRA